MATAEELLNTISQNQVSVLSEDDRIFVIDGESRTITVPDSERLFGVEGDKDVERKYFQCPKIVGDNIDLSQHQIYVSYVFTTTENNTSFPDESTGLYHCDDVETSGDNITFSWLLSGNVFANPGFIAFKVMAKKSEGGELKTKWNTAPAVGTVLLTVPDGEEIEEEYPDVINQIFDRLDALEAGGGSGTGGTTNYENLSNKPRLNGVTLEGNKTLDQVGVLAKNQGASNSGKYLSVGSDGNVVPANAPSGGTVDPEQIKQAVNGYLEENPVSGMTAEQEQQLNQNTTDVADLKSAIGDLDRLETANNGDLVSAINEANQNSNGGLTDEIKQALLQIASKVAYVDTDGQSYYDNLLYSLYPEMDSRYSMYITVANEALKKGYIGDDGNFVSNQTSYLIDKFVKALPFIIAYSESSTTNVTLRSTYYDSNRSFLSRDYTLVGSSLIKTVDNPSAVYEKVGWDGNLNVSYVFLLNEIDNSLFTNENVSIDASGELNSELNFHATNLIKIPSGCDKYVLYSTYNVDVKKVAFYDSNKTFISREYTGLTNGLFKYGDIPADAAYYRASKPISSILYAIIMKGI